MRPHTIIAIGLLLRVTWASYISYLGFGLGLESDSQNFYLQILDILRTSNFAGFDVGPGLVVNFLAISLMPFGPNLFLACIICCLFWWLSGIFFLKSLSLLECTQRQMAWSALLFSFWPTAIPYTSIPLREPFQLCFVNLALFGAVALLKTRLLRYWVPLIVGAVLAARLHGALTLFGIVTVIATSFFYSLTSGRKFPILLVLLTLALTGLVIFFGNFLIASSSYDLSNGTLSSIQEYQKGGLDEYARSAYKAEVQVLNAGSALVALPVGLFQYLFEPLPNRIGTLADGILTLENLIRLLILVLIPSTIRGTSNKLARLQFIFIVILYLSQEFIWSTGTVNWGTASRHHVPAMGLLFLIAAHHRLFARSQRADYRYPKNQDIGFRRAIY